MDRLALEESASVMLDELMGRHPLRSRPEMVWKGLRVSAGIAYYRLNRIGLSKVLLTDEDRLRTTLVHEYAHLLAVERHGQKAANHGPLWQAAMRDLGVVPVRTHRYEVQRNDRKQSVHYACKRCGAQFSRSRMLPKRRKYVHAQCGGALSFVGIERTNDDPIS